jgi:hypothetical protein
MPTISQFFGILIHMDIRGEHNPPHFHALYAEHEALILEKAVSREAAKNAKENQGLEGVYRSPDG